MGAVPSSSELATMIADLAAPLADERAVEVLEVVVKGESGRHLVKLVADADEGLDIDAIASLSRAVGAVLEERDIFPGAYTLEVTSPGADRPLVTERDYRRNLGRDIRIVQRDVADPDRTSELSGRCHEVVDGILTINVKGRMLAVPLETVVSGAVVLPW